MEIEFTGSQETRPLGIAHLKPGAVFSVAGTDSYYLLTDEGSAVSLRSGFLDEAKGFEGDEVVEVNAKVVIER